MLLELNRLRNETEAAITEKRALGEGATATEWRKVELFIFAMIYELRMWLSLKEHNAGLAWSCFVTAQDNAVCAARVLADYAPLVRLTAHLDDVEQVVFPKQHFVSPSITVNRDDFECSICGKRGGCSHQPGFLYDGLIVGRIVHNIKSAREVSLVTNPASKRYRLVAFGHIDSLTGEKIQEVSSMAKRVSRKRRRS